MARSVGITISAVVVFIGCAFTLLFGGLAALGSAMMSLRPTANVPAFVGFLAIVEAVFALGFSGWGIATGVGLINTKEWARISTIVFAALLALFTLPTALFVAFVPLPIPKDPNLPSHFALTIRAGISVFYGLLGALAIFWLFFFNRRSVKEQFRRKRPVLDESTQYLPSEIPSAKPAMPSSARPLSITIIAWFLLVGSASLPFFLLYSRTMFRNVPVPFCFLGFFLFGRGAALVLLLWMVVQIGAAVGLLRLQNWARLTTIWLQLFGILNVLLVVAIPANRVRYQHIMDAAMASISSQMPQPVSFSFPAWIGMAASLPVVLVILWFLITRKEAFVSAS